MTLTFDFTITRTCLSFRLGRWDIFAQRERVPAARYGFTRCAKGTGILDLPGWSIAYTNFKRFERGQAERATGASEVS